MARGINKVILVGQLGDDPSIKYMPSGSAVATISLATNESWKDKNTGQHQERAEWHRVVFFNRLAEIADQYLRKGSQVYVEGKLQTDKWRDKEGIDRYTTKIIAHNLQMLGKHSEGASHSGEAQPQGRGAGNGASAQQYRDAQSGQASRQPEPEFDDDVPF